MADDGVGRVEVVYHPGESPGSPLRVRVGSEIVVTLHGSYAYGWAPVEVAVGPLEVTTTDTQEGTVRATVRAVAPGEAELRSTSSFRGDRFGPQTRLWRLPLRIDP